MSVLWKQIEFYKGKSDCEEVVIAVLELRQCPGEVSEGKLYSWPKNLYQFMTNLFFLANVPTPGRVQYHVKKNLKPNCLRRQSTGVGERCQLLQCHIRLEVHYDNAKKNKSAVSCAYRQNKHNFASVCFFRFKIKQQNLIIQESKKTKRNFPANIYLFKVNNKNTRKRCEICSQLTIKTPERRQ